MLLTIAAQGRLPTTAQGMSTQTSENITMVSDLPNTETSGATVPPTPPAASTPDLDPNSDYWVVGSFYDFRCPGLVVSSEFIFESLEDAIGKATTWAGEELRSIYIWHWPETEGVRKPIAIACKGDLYLQSEFEGVIADWAIDQQVRLDEPSIQSAIAQQAETEPQIQTSWHFQPSPTNPLRSAYPWVTPGDGEFAMEPGITKRELFAAMAMQGHLAGGDYWEPEHLAEASLEKADALLTELAK